MKKFFSLLLSALLCISLVSAVCAEGEEEAAADESLLNYIDYTSTDVIAENSGAGYATLEEAAESISKTPLTGIYSLIAGSEAVKDAEASEFLFDNDTTTKFCSRTFPTISVAKLAVPVTVDGVIMATANDNAKNPDRNAFEWAVFVSSDGENWTQLIYGDDTFFEDVDYTYFASAVNPVENVQYIQLQTEGGLSGCFQMSEFVLCGTLEAALPEITEEAPAAEETVEEAPVVEEAVEVPAVEEAPAEETVAAPVVAPQTFDMGIIAAAVAVVSLAGYAASKKH